MPHASALPNLLRCCSCLLCMLFLCRSLLCQLVHCFGFLQPLLYSAYFAVHGGITCLHYTCWDSMSGFPGMWLVIWLCDCMLGKHVWLPWPVVGQLHAGIAYLHYACWDSMSSFLACDWLVTNGCFNPIGVNPIIAWHNYLETNLLSTYPISPSIWPRFIDDIFMIWRYGEQN